VDINYILPDASNNHIYQRHWLNARQLVARGIALYKRIFLPSQNLGKDVGRKRKNRERKDE
jgi:hypothetical protein